MRIQPKLYTGCMLETSRSRVFALGCLYMVYNLSGQGERAIETCVEAVARRLNYVSMHITAVYTLAALLQSKGQLRRSFLKKMARRCCAAQPAHNLANSQPREADRTKNRVTFILICKNKSQFQHAFRERD